MNKNQLFYKENSSKNRKKSKTRISPLEQVKSLKKIIFYIFFSMFSFRRCQAIATNQVINGNFSQPYFSGGYKFFDKSIPGWNCTFKCQIQNCNFRNIINLQGNKISGNCLGQVMDLNSLYINQKISQKMRLKSGYYLLHFTYFYPVQASRKKVLQAQFNKDNLLYHRPLVDGSPTGFQFQNIVKAVDGINILSFANLGYVNDGIGFRINNVSLYRIFDENYETILKVFSEELSFMNTVPGFRVVFRSALTFLINFDRLQLYIYHNRTYSYNSQLLLIAINDFLSVKSNLAKNILALTDAKSVKQQESFMESIDFKQEYTKYPSFSTDYQCSSYFQNFNDSFVYFFPFVFLLLVGFNIAFKALFNRPISQLFRKFSFWVILLIMMFDGNIEAMTFFTFSEFKLFFSNCFKHKIVNTLIGFFFFLLVFIVFGLLPWAKFYYKKKAKYLLDQSKAQQEVLWGTIIDRGVICFLFGAAHCLLLDSPNLQLLCLMLIQVLWIIKKIFYVKKGFQDQKLMITMGIVTGLCRVFFQVMSYIYQNEPNSRLYINQTLHSPLTYVMLSAGAIEFFIGCICCVISLRKTFIRDNKNKVGHYVQDFEKVIPLKEKKHIRKVRFEIRESHINKQTDDAQNKYIQALKFYARRQNKQTRLTIGNQHIKQEVFVKTSKITRWRTLKS